MELSEAGDLPVRAYSLGMRRKLLLARALLHRPPLLYLDEPTANLDAHSAAHVRRTLRGPHLTGLLEDYFTRPRPAQPSANEPQQRRAA